jgi:hypothetical protein
MSTQGRLRMKKRGQQVSRYPQLNQVAHAISAVDIAEERLMEAGLLNCAGLVRQAKDLANAEFMIHWEAMLKAEGRWSDDEASNRGHLAMSRLYLGEI